MTSDTGIGSMAEAIAEEADPGTSAANDPVEKWPSALATLASARIAIISAEAGDASAIFLVKAIWGVVGILCGVAFWILLLVGLIGFIPKLTPLTWFQVTFIIAAIHLVIAIIALVSIQKKTAPVFTITKSEFSKDKQWLSSVKHRSTSKN